jgi:hypothetical protein
MMLIYLNNSNRESIIYTYNYIILNIIYNITYIYIYICWMLYIIINVVKQKLRHFELI